MAQEPGLQEIAEGGRPIKKAGPILLGTAFFLVAGESQNFL